MLSGLAPKEAAPCLPTCPVPGPVPVFLPFASALPARGPAPFSPRSLSQQLTRPGAGAVGYGVNCRLTRAHTAARWLLQQIPRCVLVTAWVPCPAVRVLSGEASRRWHPPSRHVPVAVSPLSHGPRGLPGGRACPSGPPAAPCSGPRPRPPRPAPAPQSGSRGRAGRVTGAPPRLGLPRAPCRGPLLLFPRPQRWAWPPRAGGQGLHSALYLLKVSFLPQRCRKPQPPTPSPCVCSRAALSHDAAAAPPPGRPRLAQLALRAGFPSLRWELFLGATCLPPRSPLSPPRPRTAAVPARLPGGSCRGQRAVSRSLAPTLSRAGAVVAFLGMALPS